VLGTELGRVRSWPDSLASEPEPELKALGERLRAIIAQGDQALAERHKAAATRADHRSLFHYHAGVSRPRLYSFRL
jgi:hypothetical protein